jgi:hypothetical protein
MYPNDITLAGTSTSKTYSLISVNGGKAIRTDATAPLGAPLSLVVSHQAVTQAGVVVDRHLVRFDDLIPGVSPAPDVTPSVQLVIAVPRETVTVAQVKDIIARLQSFLSTAGYVDKLLNNEP